jgi:predicted secreted protein
MIGAVIHFAVLLSAYAVLWFLCLFCLLPIGLGVVDPETGAPLKPMLGRKALISTAVAAVVWFGFYLAIRFGWLKL